MELHNHTIPKVLFHGIPSAEVVVNKRGRTFDLQTLGPHSSQARKTRREEPNVCRRKRDTGMYQYRHKIRGEGQSCGQSSLIPGAITEVT